MGARRAAFDHALEADRVECQWVDLHPSGKADYRWAREAALAAEPIASNEH